MNKTQRALTAVTCAALAVAHGQETVVYKQADQRGLHLFIEKPPAWKAADQRPAVVFLGDSDKLIPVSVLRDFEAGMQQAGVRCDAHVYPNAGHGFFNKDPHFTSTLIETDKFLSSLGWLKGPPALPPQGGADCEKPVR